MVLDTSAFLAILFGEPEAESMARAIEQDPRRYVSTVNLFEASIVIENRRGRAALSRLDLLVLEAEIAALPFRIEEMRIAREAYRRFGKGRHPAALNFGDCIAYASAKALGEPLLFKGDDFARTDIDSALRSGRSKAAD